MRIILACLLLFGCHASSQAKDLAFIVAGQSNANSGPWDSSTEYSHTGKVTIEEYGKAPRIPTQVNPLVESRSWLLLGDMLKRDVLFTNVAVGGSSAQEWVDTYNSRIEGALRKRHYDAVLWVQGESECANHTSKSDLHVLLDTLIIASRSIQKDLTWFIALDSCVYPALSAPVREAEKETVMMQTNVKQGPDLDVIRKIPSEMTPNLVEFSGEGLRHHAELWYPILKNFKE